MDIGSDTELLAAVNAVIADRPAGEVLNAFYHRAIAVLDDAVDTLAGRLPDEQISLVKLVDRLKFSRLQSVVLLLTALRKMRTEDAWVHYNLAKHLEPLVDLGVPEAKLPAIIHAQLAIEGLKDSQPSAQPFLRNVIARELSNFSPREAVRIGTVGGRRVDARGLEVVEPALGMLGLGVTDAGSPITRLLQVVEALHFTSDDTSRLAHFGDAAGFRSVTIEPRRRITLPPVRGDSSHYIFAGAAREMDLPEISVHILEGGTFSIDTKARGLEHHYVFDRDKECVLALANGTDPFIADEVLECDEPVAILDDRFSGAMNICHFLLDRIARIPIYERALSRPGKFFLMDDAPYYRDIIARLGLADRVIIPSSKRVSIHAPEILFSSNIASAFRHPAHYCATWAIDYLRHELRIEDRPARAGRKLVISREDANGRRILNWEEVLPAFRRRGFEVVVLAGLSTDAQIELFRDAAQVVGVHGAGLTNLLFAPRDCAVLEILPPLVAVADYWLLASSLGQRYSALIADDAEFPRPDYENWGHRPAYNDRDLVVPLDRLEAALTLLDDDISAPSRANLVKFQRGRPGELARQEPASRAISKQQTSVKVPLLNVALHRPVTQSSDSGIRCPSKPLGSNATSGVKTGGFGFHTKTEADPWWMLDLQRVRDIHQVVVYNRQTANPDNANAMAVSLSLDPAGPWREIHRCNGRFGGTLDKAPLVVSLDESIPARYVRLHVNGTTAFHLDEVEVYAPVAPDDPTAARIADAYASLKRIPEELKEAGSDLVNSEAWNWAVFRGKYDIDAPRLHSRWFAHKPRFVIDPNIPFDGEIEALRVRPAGGLGNVFYDILNACLIARVMKCSVLEVPTIEGGLDHLPLVVDGFRIELVGSSNTNRPTLEASFYWPNGFEPMLGDYGTDFLIDTVKRYVAPIFGKFANGRGAAQELGDHVLALHFRGGDIFTADNSHVWYVQPPASFYLKAIEFAMSTLGVSAVHLVYQDHANPCVEIVSNFLARHGIPHTSQSSSVPEDVATLMSARHIVAPFSTFCEMVGLLSERIRSYIGFRAISTQQAITYWAQSRVEDVLRAKGARTFVIDDADQSYIKPNTWSNTPEQIDLMRTFPATKLRLLERTAPSGRLQTPALEEAVSRA